MNAQDRLQRCCDRCGAVARFYVHVGDNLELLLCRHHATKHEQALVERYSVQAVTR